MLKRLQLFVIVTLFFFLCTFSYAQKKESTVYQRARIHYKSNNDFIKLINSNIALDHGIRKSKEYIESVFSEKEIEQAKKLGFKVDILIEDMQAYILDRNINELKINPKTPTPCDDNTIDYTTPNNFNLGSMAGYLTYSEILQELDDMRTAYPNLITTKAAISTFTTENGNTLQWVKISDNPDTDEAESEILYTALHHAREPAAMQQLIFYMWYLLENYATDAEVKAIVDHSELYFVPVVNPDGYLYNESISPNGGGMWRKNRKNNGNGTFGVDNNRNYDYIDGNGNSIWNTTGTSNDMSSEIYAGTGPFSEIENQAIKWFVEQHDFKVALNNHTFGDDLLFPFGYSNATTTADNETFKVISNEMVSQNEYGNIMSANLYPAAGDSDDYMYGTIGTHSKIFAMTPEIGNSFWPAQSEIIPISKEMVYFNLTAAHTVNNYATITDAHTQFIASTTGSFDYSLKRLGIQGTGSFTVSIIPISSNILNVGNSNSHNSLTLLEQQTGSISYTLDNSIDIGNLIEYKLVIDNGLYTTEKVISKIYGNPQIEIEDLANNLNNWTSASWDTTTSEFVSASSSITDSPSGNYSNSQNNIIELTDVIDLTTAGIAIVEFNAKWDIEAGFDYVQFEVSSNNGTSWEPQCGNYTRKGTQDHGIIGQPLYDGKQSNWVQEAVDLSTYFGETIKMRFQLVSGSGTTGDGFYFDDFKISTIDQTALSTSSFDKIDAKVFPNPVKENITIVLPSTNDTSIKLYSINGQLVKQTNTSLISTTISLKNLSQGVYILKLQTSTGIGTYKIVKE